MTTPRLTPPKATRQSDHSDLLDRMDMLEVLVKQVASNQEETKQSINRMRDRSDENERAVNKLADQLKENTKQFTEALSELAAGQKKSQQAFTDALEKQTTASLDALQKALLQSIAQKIGQWLMTVAGAAVLMGASWFWSRQGK